MIRQNPDNPCIIESSVNGTDWCPFIDLSLCNNAGQPGSGSEQPPAGGCVTYRLQLSASGKVLLPTQVSGGDTIQILNANGAGNDGSDLEWYCPDGEQFALGACIGFEHTSGSDPLPSANHMEIILKLDDGTYHRAQSSPYTVSGGAVNSQAILQVNDTDLSDNAGSYSLDVLVCNNQTEQIHLAYALGAHGPATVNVGEEFDFVVDVFDGAAYNGGLYFDRCINGTLISTTGGPVTQANHQNCAGTLISGFSLTAVHEIGTNSSVSPFTLRLRIDSIV